MRALLGYVKTNPHDHTEYLAHIEDLASIAVSAGYDPVDVVIQILKKENPAYVFGKGKVDEIAEKILEKDVETFITYNILSSIQKINLERKLGVKVIDRYDLTLEIFEKHSSDQASKMQIELARILKQFSYEKLRASIKYFVEHPGPKSMGEYAYHRVIGQLRRRIKMLEGEIDSARRKRLMQLKKRKALGHPIMVLTGYYNAGKTSLFNLLTNLRKPVSDAPFTTLSSKYYLARRLGKKFFVVDTIGFAMGLDPRLIHAFRLTLDDVINSDAVILVVDSSDSNRLLKLRFQSSMEILSSLGIGDNKIVVALNKIDMITRAEIREKEAILASLNSRIPIIPISVKQRININELVATALTIATAEKVESLAL